MATTPLIRPISAQGGTFYSFSSSAEDLSSTFNNSNNKFVVSKFCLINIPNIATPSNNENKIQFKAIDTALLGHINASNNINLAQSFQNYCLNLESMLISRPQSASDLGYDRNLKLNVAERTFWKWLKELGAIRFRPANSAEAFVPSRFTEETDTQTGLNQYNRLVQYIGNIDIVNNVQNTTNAYSELYIHVPTKDGNTPVALFKTVSDNNYKENMTLQNLPANPLNNEVLVGRNYNDIHPVGLDIKAFYDQDDIGNPLMEILDINTNMFVQETWHDPRTVSNTYFTESAFNNPANDVIKKTITGDTVTYKRSKLDGIMLDFNPDSYTLIKEDPATNTIEDLNSTVQSKNFEFNAVLVYYDVYDPNNTADFATNLYGVLFLDDVEQNGLEDAIPRFRKFIPDPITKLNGNSYGFKINLKFDTSVDNVGVEKAINDYSSFSMNMFIDALNILKSAAADLNTRTADIINLKEKVESLEDLILNTDDVSAIMLRLTTIEDSLLQNQSLFNNTASIVQLINKTRTEVNDLIAGKSNIEISYNSDIIKPGIGIDIDRTTPNIVKINNKVQTYSIGSKFKPSTSNVYTTTHKGDLSLGGTISLQRYTNYFKHYKSGINTITTNDIYIYLDDTDIQWSNGQTFRLVFEDPIELGSYSLVIFTDALNTQGNGAFGKDIIVFTHLDFTPSLDKPIFEFICVNATTLDFEVDQIK
jgi:hypothetical protein